MNNEKYHSQLKEFLDEGLSIAWAGGDWDGCDIQEFAVKIGLVHIVRIEKRADCHFQHCNCEEFDFPIDCHRRF